MDRSLKRRKDHILSKKIGSVLTGRRNPARNDKVKHSKTPKRSQSSIVDGFTNTHVIQQIISVANLALFLTLLRISYPSCNILLVLTYRSIQTVTEALEKLRPNK